MQLAESLSMAFLFILERLSETERAVFLLREVFSFDYAEVARIVGRSAVATRQIAKRARDRLRGGAARFTTSREEAERLAHRFVEACARGDMASLHDILTENVVSWNDGGGRTAAARKLVRGRERVARLFVGLFRKWPDATIRFAHVNGQPGVLARASDGRLVVISFAFANGRIEGVFVVVNPEKLRRVPPLV
jgi:RNA polymerase sigma-70 factor (ECF subfamily)